MHKLLSVYTHLLISWPHWLPTIKYEQTFELFVLLGCVQIVIAVWSALLAIIALPSDKRRWPHAAGFLILGSILFALTFRIGVLNDVNQSDADDKAAVNGHKLDQMGFMVGGLKSSYLGLPRASVDSNHSLTKPQVRYVNQLDAVRDFASPSKAPERDTVPGVSWLSSNKNNPVKVDNSQMDLVVANLDALIQGVKTADFAVAEEVGHLKHQMGFAMDPSAMRSTGPMPAGWQERFLVLLCGRERSLNSFEPQIATLRNEALGLLRMTPEQTAIDNVTFAQAETSASSSCPQRLEIQDIDQYGPPKFIGLTDYLRALRNDLKPVP